MIDYLPVSPVAVGLCLQGFANYTYDLIVALNKTQADVQVNGTLIIQRVRHSKKLHFVELSLLLTTVIFT